jgi:hypothetical protein
MDVGQLIGEQGLIELVPPNIDTIRPDNVWVNYEVDTDTFIVYLSQQPAPGVSHYITENLMAITPLDSNEVIGFQIEGWEGEYLLTQPKLAEWWPSFKQSLAGDKSWSPQLIIMAWLLLFSALLVPAPDVKQHLALAAA